MEEKGFLKDLWENLEERLCLAALLAMVLVIFMDVLSRKTTWFNMSFTQELVTAMFVWICCLAVASVFRTDSHMDFNCLADKPTGTGRKVHRIYRFLLCSANCGIWTIQGAQMTYRQCHHHLLTSTLEMSQWAIGIAIPSSAIFSTVRIVQYEVGLAEEGN